MDVRYVAKDVRGFCFGDFEIEFIHGRLFFFTIYNNCYNGFVLDFNRICLEIIFYNG
jgi:hypothetical protein